MFIEFERYELMSWFYLIANLIYYAVFYLDKRYFEMQFNSHVMGYWTKIYEFTHIDSTKLIKKPNADKDFKPKDHEPELEDIIKEAEQEEIDKVKTGISAELAKGKKEVITKE